jgi:GT2 family glycosyltransferase
MGIPFWRGFVDIGRKELDQGQYDSTGFSPFSFCGATALIRRDIFMKVGGFDEKFFLFNEDVELSWRMRLLGYRIGFAPGARVAHYFSGSVGSKNVDARVLYYCHRNLLRAILKNCGSSLFWALGDYFLFSMIVISGFFIFDCKRAMAFVRAILWNLFNFRDTYKCRLRIQALRITSEEDMLVSMYKDINRYEPAEHINLRHILNVLFQHSQCSHLHRK